ncbi:MAG: hypothetical protein K2J02_04145, partial [Malacoplasma sp.]|nr:hypothetical protein [Malacoplasma sp.]
MEEFIILMTDEHWESDPELAVPAFKQVHNIFWGTTKIVEDVAETQRNQEMFNLQHKEKTELFLKSKETLINEIVERGLHLFFANHNECTKSDEKKLTIVIKKYIDEIEEKCKNFRIILSEPRWEKELMEMELENKSNSTALLSSEANLLSVFKKIKIKNAEMEKIELIKKISDIEEEISEKIE